MSAEDGHWTRFWDAEQNAHYYHHSVLDESVWDAPKGCAIWDENGMLLQKAGAAAGADIPDAPPHVQQAAEEAERALSTNGSHRADSAASAVPSGVGLDTPSVEVDMKRTHSTSSMSSVGGENAWEMAADLQGKNAASFTGAHAVYQV